MAQGPQSSYYFDKLWCHIANFLVVQGIPGQFKFCAPKESIYINEILSLLLNSFPYAIWLKAPKVTITLTPDWEFARLQILIAQGIPGQDEFCAPWESIYINHILSLLLSSFPLTKYYIDLLKLLKLNKTQAFMYSQVTILCTGLINVLTIIFSKQYV